MSAAGLAFVTVQRTSKCNSAVSRSCDVASILVKVVAWSRSDIGTQRAFDVLLQVFLYFLESTAQILQLAQARIEIEVSEHSCWILCAYSFDELRPLCC